MPPDDELSQPDSIAPAPPSVAAAEAAAAKAATRARKARARARRLHRRASAEQHRHRLPKGRRLRRLPRWRQLIAAAGIALTCAASAASASIWWQHRGAADQRYLAAEFTTAARQAALDLLTLDYAKTKEHIQRVLDNSTGSFRAGLEQTAEAVTKRLEQSKVVATAEVKATAVQSVSADTGVVLVAVQTEPAETENPEQPTSWRLALTLTRDGDQLKISDVQFIE